MERPSPERVHWRDNPDAVELGFDFYLQFLEQRLKGERISLVQSIRGFYKEELDIDLRETQARGLMHMTGSVFIDYVRAVSGSEFTPGVQFWEAQGIDRFYQWKENFYLARNQQAVDLEGETGIIEPVISLTDETTGIPRRQQSVVNRIIRDSALSRFVKSLYDYCCQICTFSFELPSGSQYTESHHVRPLGRRHGGIDKETNMMVLCPNHHAMMDFGVIAVHPDKLVVLSTGRDTRYDSKPLQLMNHPIRKEFLEYHMSNIFNKVA